jgi:hypothetical protein
MAMRIDSSLRLDNDSEPHGEGWWKWSVWVDGSPADLATVTSVTYRLHPTFPKPIVTVTNADTKFRLASAGWGEFAIAADVERKDGSTIRLERWLQLGDNEAAPDEVSRPSVFLSYSIADTEIVDALRQALTNGGLDVRTAQQSVDAGEAFPLQIAQQLEEVDAVVAVLSNPQSHFVEREAQLARQRGQYVVPVVIGDAKVDSKLSDLARFEIHDRRNIDGLAQQIVARVKDHVTPEEGA